jgi:hypothetical protein
MLLKTKHPLTDLEEKPLQIRDGDVVREMTIGTICVQCLLGGKQDELTGADKLERYELAKKLHDNDTVDLSAEQVVWLKEEIAKNFVSLISGQAWTILDPRGKK